MPESPELDPADAALAAAALTSSTSSAEWDLDGLAAAVGASRTLLESLERAGLLLPRYVDAAGTPRYGASEAEAVQAGLALVDAGLPLAELLDLARRTDEAVREVAAHAVELFLRFVRDPVRGSAVDDEEAAARLVTAYELMLPATERLVALHMRHRLLAAAAARLAAEAAEESAAGPPAADSPNVEPPDALGEAPR